MLSVLCCIFTASSLSNTMLGEQANGQQGVIYTAAYQTQVRFYMWYH